MYEEILDKIVWSFSAVNSYCNCPKGFKLARIDHVPQVQNAFSDFGSFMHSLLEMYFKGEVEFFELSSIYQEKYDENVTHKFPKNSYVDLSEKYYEDGKKYFDFFEGISDQYEVLSVEVKAELVIKGRPFIGFIDLILRDKEDGKIVIWDHKSKSGFKSKAELRDYLHQIYLYALYVKEHYGEYPKELTFNMFRKNELITTAFDPEACNQAIDWFVETIDRIYNDILFDDKISISYFEKFKDIGSFKKDDFFCNELCGVREHCERSSKYKGNRRKAGGQNSNRQGESKRSERKTR